MRIPNPLFILLAAGTALTAAPLPIDVKNPSFEDQKTTLNGDGDGLPIGSDPGDFTVNVVPQWTAASAGLFNPDQPLNFAPDSILVVFLDNNGSITQPLVFPGGATVTASPGAQLTVTLMARPRTPGTSNMTFDARVGGVSVAAAPAAYTLAANATGYTAVSATITLKNAAGLGTANGQQISLFIGSSGTQANIDAVGAAIIYPPAINALSAAPQPATAGQPVTVSWTVANADSITFNGTDVTGQTNAVITGPATPQTYTLSATNADGTSTASVLVDVLPAAIPAAAVRINEVATENSTGLQDEDSTYQDWIELYNTSGGTVNLAGWHLTDDRALPAKWTFPAVSIAPGGYLVVFASAKNRSTTPLHTNFKLDNDGEYLALTNAANAVVSAVNLPTLAPHTTWGHGIGNTRTLVTVSPDNAALKWTVPAAPVSDDWRGGAAFDDSTWTNGQWALGYSNQTTNPYAIAAGAVGGQNYAGALGHDLDVVRPIQVTELACFDSQSNGMARTITTVLWSRNQNGTPSSTSDDTGLAVLASEVFSAVSPGTLVGGQRFKPLAVPITLPPGSYTILAYNYGSGESNGNNATTFLAGLSDGGGAVRFVGSSRFGVAAPPASPAASFPGSPDGGPVARYGAGSFRFREVGAFATNTESAMFNVNASVLTRTPFAIGGAAPQCLSLNVTYDDGFVAWLNGVEVARRNAPALPAFNSTATATAAASTSVSIPFDGSLLQPGNVLAVHGLNAAANDTDFQLRASITGEAEGTIAGFIATPTPGTLNGSATLASHVVINEIHSDPPDSKLKWVEFVELYNPLSTPVNVGGWLLTGGVTFSIPGGTMIPACGYLVIGESPAQMQTYLGYSGALGPWTGSLRNEDDEIVLRDPALIVVDRVNFELSFPWPTVGDDPGDSMQRINEGLESNLGASWRSALPTPGARNSITAGTAPPAIRQVAHAPVAPTSGQAVTISAKITDPEGIAAAWLEYQIVEPGSYIRITDPAWITNWITLPMTDAGSDNFTAVIPGSVQTHRRLIRYRIRSWDGALRQIRVPYADDDSPNFAFFCYDGVPAWTGAVQPGVTPAATFGAATMSKVRPWHLLSNATDVQNCQYVAAFNDGTYRFEATLVIGDKVYDHIHYRVKGQNSTFNTGKNKWKLKFNRGRMLKMPDDYGLSSTDVRTLNISSMPAPWAPWNRGLHGLDEAVAFRLSNLAGAPAPYTSYLQLRVIDGVEQNPANQYDSDLWGLYLAFENTDNRFKESHGLPDGNIYRLQTTGAGNSVLGFGKGQTGDLTALNNFTSTTTGYRLGGGSATVAPLVTAIQPETWFRTNVNLPEYFNWRAVTEAVNQTDRREQENVVYFRDPTDGRWQILPWDVDLLYENFDRWGPQATQNANNLNQYEQIARGLIHPAILTDFQNRARELQDLLLNSDQTWKAVDEFVSIITDETPRIIPNGGAITDGFAEVERRRWDYNPINPTPPRGAGPAGNYYKTPYPIGNQGNGPFPQPYNRVLPSGDFEGMVKWVKDFIATGPYGGGRLAKMARGETNPYTLAATTAIQIPATPIIVYNGHAGFALNQLAFTSSAFSSPNGQTFAAMQWRIGEIYDPSVAGFTAGQPWRYEVEGVWTPAESTTFNANVNPPATGLIAGRTYRARVKHKDSLGRWSHWSAPVEFVAGTAIPGDLAANLVISEIMYNPPAPQGGDAEFIELMNIHPGAPLDLTGVQFTAGIAFAFAPGTTLAPGARIVLVRNAAVFAAKYPGVTIGGTFTDSLNNGGEQLTLGLGGGAPAIRNFTYDNNFPWPTAADNGGASLVLIAPQTNPDHSNPLNWRASTTPNPGSSDTATYELWRIALSQPDPNADTDNDGLTAFMEYSLGGDPGVPSLTTLPTLTRQPDGSALYTFTKPLAADDSGWEIQSGNDLTGWSPATATLLARSTDAGMETFTFIIPASAFNDPRSYWRTRLWLR